MAELLADVAAQSLKRGRAKPKPAKLPPDAVEISLLLTITQARLFARFLRRGATIGLAWGGDNEDERAEIEATIGSIGSQFARAGFTDELWRTRPGAVSGEGQGRA